MICNFSKENCSRVWDRIKEHCPSVCLYLVDRAEEEGISPGSATRTDILDWCLSNQFELIETEADPEDEEEDDFGEDGKARIVSALKAHTWSDLDLLDEVPGPGARAPEAPGAESPNDQEDPKSDSEGEEDISFEDLLSQLR